MKSALMESIAAPVQALSEDARRVRDALGGARPGDADVTQWPHTRPEGRAHS